MDVTAWGPTAENMGKFTKKGSSICVAGRLKLDSWQDKESGAKRSKLSVTATNVTFLDAKSQSDGTATIGRTEPAIPATSQLLDGEIPF